MDNTGEAPAGLLPSGNAGSNTATDHIAVLDACLAQIPEPHRYGTPILIHADTTGSATQFLAHIRALRTTGIDIRFSVGLPVTEDIRAVLAHLVNAPVWTPALDADGDLRDRAGLVEISAMAAMSGHPDGTRIIARRERPHPGAQLSLFDEATGWRHQLFITDTPPGGGSIPYLDIRHRAHARVEDRIRCGKVTGFDRFPSRVFAINAAWLQLALTGIDLLAWTRWLLLDDELSTAEPATLRYRILHTAAHITRGGRRIRLRIAAHWPWRHHIVTAFTRLATLPQPIT